MSKRVIWSLLLIVLCVILFVVNDHKIVLELGISSIKATAAFVYLGFTALGVVIGAMLR